MATPISPNQVQEWIDQALGEQPDIGMRKALMDVLFEARSPFDPRAKRKPKAAFALGLGLFAATAICFCYFNLGG